ncbi:MAG: hypothetical protein ACUVR4_12010 [Anaerolineae bacterium]
MKAGMPYSFKEKAEIVAGLLLGRTMVNMLAHLPSAATVQFQPAPGR